MLPALFFAMVLTGACGGAPLHPDASEGPPAGASGASGSHTAGSSGVPSAGFGGGAAAGFTRASGSTGTEPAPGQLQISGPEAVARLARALWIDLPDDELLLPAEQGQFKTASDLVPVIRKMLADPRAAKGVGAFYRWWLGLEGVSAIKKDAMLFPTFTPALANDMARETETFAVSVTVDPSGTYRDLMTSPATFLNTRLADLYDVPGISGDGLQRSALDPSRRAGIVTQPAILVQGTNFTANDPSMRGAFIATKFLCKQLPTVPEGENRFETPPLGVTVRKALTAAVATQNCAACHALLDPSGYALESFDAIGRWRTMDNGGVIDTTSTDVGRLLGEPTLSIEGPVALAAALTDAPDAQRCMVRQWYAYVLHQQPSDISDALVAETYPTFQGSGLKLQDLIVAVLTSARFLTSTIPGGFD